MSNNDEVNDRSNSKDASDSNREMDKKNNIDTNKEIVSVDEEKGNSDSTEVNPEEAVINADNEESNENETEELSADDMLLEAQETVRKLTDTLQRERADFINYRKRALKESEGNQRNTVSKILQEMIPALDAFDQLFSTEDMKNGGNVKQIIDGVKLIQKQIWQGFSNLGLEEIDPADKEFDPLSMEALSVAESKDVKKETVGKVYQKGYQLGEMVMRPARVEVMKPAPKKNKKES